MKDPLLELLEDCIVYIKGDSGFGTGFFIASGMIITCAHVVQDSKQVTVEWRGTTKTALKHSLIVKDSTPHIWPDIAILKADFEGHPCVALKPDARTTDPIYAWGFTKHYHGDPIQGTIVGESGKPRFLKFQHTSTHPGMSGSPILNLRTGGICGMVAVAILDSQGGGRAVSANVLREFLSELFAVNELFLFDDRVWLNSLSESQLAEGKWLRPVVSLQGRAELNDIEPNKPDSIFCIKSVSESIVLVCTNNGPFVWDITRKEIRWGLKGWMENAAVSPDCSLLVLAVAGVILWDLRTGEKLPPIDEHHFLWTHKKLVFSPNSQLLACVLKDFTFLPVDTSNIEIGLLRLSTYEKGVLLDTGLGAMPEAVTFSDDGKLLAAALLPWGASTVYLWSTGSGQLLRKLRLPLRLRWRFTITALAFHQSFLLASGPALIRWNASDGQYLGEVPDSGGGAVITAIAVDPSSQWMVEGNEIGRISLRSLPSYKRIQHLSSHSAAIVGLDLSPDGRWLTSWATDGSAKLHDLQKKHEAIDLGLEALWAGIHNA